jgi:Skp family chaperone for outer membrane proteins
VSPVFIQGGELRVPPNAETTPHSLQTPPASAEAAAKTPTARVAVIDVQYLFRNHDGFRRSMEALEAHVKSDKDRARQLHAEIEELQRKMKDVQSGTPKHNVLEAQIGDLEGQLEAFVKTRKNEYRQQQMKIYLDTWSDINARVSQYAKQHDIDVVLRRNKPESADQPGEVNKNQSQDDRLACEESAAIKRINEVVIYQRAPASGDKPDITLEIVAGLGHASSANEASAK